MKIKEDYRNESVGRLLIPFLTKTEDDLMEVCHQEMGKFFSSRNLVKKEKYIFGHGSPICLVAHLDTVHQVPREIVEQGGRLSSPTGIGGDDRNGVFAIFVILEFCQKYGLPIPSILFTKEEETTLIGAYQFAVDSCISGIGSHVSFFLELDKKGFLEVAYYDCQNAVLGTILENFTPVKGLYSDISVISEFLDVASANLSIGYYNAHTKHEYIVPEEIFDTCEEVLDIVQKYSSITTKLSLKDSAFPKRK